MTGMVSGWIMNVSYDKVSSECVYSLSKGDYARYILLHEIGHVAYLEGFHAAGRLARACPREETWCDKFGEQLPEKMGRVNSPT
jgi:hypothetical protein